jgi:hypothetical protein
LKSWLPPKQWFHGIQSTSTGGVVAVNGHTWASIRWLAQSIRWVVTTPFGRPVEPEVNRTLATESGATLAAAWRTAAVGVVSSSRGRSPPTTCGGGPGRLATAGANASGCSAKTSPGRTSSAMARSVRKSRLRVE